MNKKTTTMLLSAGLAVLLGSGAAYHAMAMDEMPDHKMADDKMAGDKMAADKMAADKMDGDKMEGDTMAGDAMADGKMSEADMAMKQKMQEKMKMMAEMDPAALQHAMIKAKAVSAMAMMMAKDPSFKAMCDKMCATPEGMKMMKDDKMAMSDPEKMNMAKAEILDNDEDMKMVVARAHMMYMAQMDASMKMDADKMGDDKMGDKMKDGMDKMGDKMDDGMNKMDDKMSGDKMK